LDDFTARWKHRTLALSQDLLVTIVADDAQGDHRTLGSAEGGDWHAGYAFAASDKLPG
jgi:hypothetical protein